MPILMEICRLLQYRRYCTYNIWTWRWLPSIISHRYSTRIYFCTICCNLKLNALILCLPAVVWLGLLLVLQVSGIKKVFFPTAKSWHSFWRDTRYFSLLWLETNYPTFLRRLRFTLQCSWSKALDFPDRTSGPLVVKACSGTEKSICYTPPQYQ